MPPQPFSGPYPGQDMYGGFQAYGQQMDPSMMGGVMQQPPMMDAMGNNFGFPGMSMMMPQFQQQQQLNYRIPYQTQQQDNEGNLVTKTVLIDVYQTDLSHDVSGMIKQAQDLISQGDVQSGQMILLKLKQEGKVTLFESLQ